MARARIPREPWAVRHAALVLTAAAFAGWMLVLAVAYALAVLD